MITDNDRTPEPCRRCGEDAITDRLGHCTICAENLRCEAADQHWERFKDRHTEHFNCRIF